MFSVVIPVHNKLPHLKRSIDSVLNQTVSEFELILVDDASTDGSSEKLQSFRDPRIRLFRRDVPGPGGYAARNIGIGAAVYDWIVFLDADDSWEAFHLEEIKKAIAQHRHAEVLSTKWETSQNDVRNEIGELKRFKGKYNRFSLADFLSIKSLMWTGAVAIKKDLLIKVGLFPEAKCKRGGDLDTWIRCLYKSEENIFINTVSAIYFRDTVNQVTDNKLNPALNICAQETIESIRSESRDERLKKALDEFCAGFVFNILVGALRRDGSFSTSKVRIIESPLIRYRVLMKAYLYKLLMKIGVR